MKQQIRASMIVGIKDFSCAAAKHAVEMKAWRAHMKRVQEDEKNDVPIERRHMRYPQPKAHPMVERVVDENDEANFEIVDDGPNAEEKLAVRKAQLIHELLIAEQTAKDAVVPRGKLRFFNLRESDILTADARRRAVALNDRTIVDRALGRRDVEAAVEATRRPEDSAFLSEQKARRDKIAVIERTAAKATHDIEDLTVDTIDGWKTPIF